MKQPRTSLAPKFASEKVNHTFNFAGRLVEGETLTAATITVVVNTGVDPSPMDLVSGDAKISGTVVTQLFVCGVVGVVYQITCSVATSAGQSLVLIGLMGVRAEVV